MAKQNKAGATERDLPWWFEIYHIAWLLSFIALWYFFDTAGLILYIIVVACLFARS